MINANTRAQSEILPHTETHAEPVVAPLAAPRRRFSLHALLEAFAFVGEIRTLPFSTNMSMHERRDPRDY